MKVNNAPTISQLQKTLLELLKDRPRWTRFQNFDTEKSCDELEECLERIEFSVGGLVAELQKRYKYELQFTKTPTIYIREVLGLLRGRPGYI